MLWLRCSNTERKTGGRARGRAGVDIELAVSRMKGIRGEDIRGTC